MALTISNLGSTKNANAPSAVDNPPLVYISQDGATWQQTTRHTRSERNWLVPTGASRYDRSAG
jgi:hypothetical protein